MESSVYQGSEEYFEYSCDPCINEGDHMEAQGFCTECEEYLCITCFKSHSRGKATRHHTLLDKDTMPRRHGRTCDPCKTVNEDKDAEGYCANCEEFLCSDCFKSHSRSKATRSHTLMDKDSMPGAPSDLTASVSKIDISEKSADNQKRNETYTYVKDVYVKDEKGEGNCIIIGMVLMSKVGLVLADIGNNSVKLIDIENDVLKGTLRLQSEPYGIAAISEDQVAVTLPERKQIQIIAISSGLSEVRTFKTNKRCGEIMYIKGKLYVSFARPTMFQIIELTGEIYKTIKPSAEVQRHCTVPEFIAVSPDGCMIYISERENNKAISIDIHGRMISMYQGELDQPCCITISPSGSIYLCSKGQHVIYKMTSDLKEATVILGGGDGLTEPLAMCFNYGKHHLYISSGNNINCIKVYKWI